MPSVILKSCATCRQRKPTTDFNAHKCRPDGLRGVCAICQRAENRASYLRHQEKRQAEKRAYQAEWRKDPENAEKNRKAASEWYRANGEVARERARRWAKENPERKREADRLWATANPDRVVANRNAWRSANLDRKLQLDRQWASRNRPKLRELGKAYRQAFPDKHAARQGRRRAAKMQATPPWATQFYIDEAYHLAKLRTLATGFEWHVDHVVPLKGKTVCGLHVESNLAVIPGRENNSKSNRYWPDMP